MAQGNFVTVPRQPTKVEFIFFLEKGSKFKSPIYERERERIKYKLKKYIVIHDIAK
jgi:hypothetical protein